MVGLRLGFAAVLVLLGGSPTSGQSLDVVVKGQVTDQTGAVLPHATITITNTESGLVRTASSDVSGLYQLPPVPPGIYDVKAERAGFLAQERTGTALHVGDAVGLDFIFDAVGATATTEVRAPSVLAATRNTVARLIAEQEIDEMPVVNRNFNGLASLAPGVTSTGVYGGVDIGGSRDFQNSYNVDGASSEGIRGEQRVIYAQDWIREFQVLTTQYSAEFGNASGGVLNVVTRSGSNELVTRGYGFFRNEAWDAMPAFASDKAPLQMKRLGGTAGGRILRDRLFFFAGGEWFDDETSQVVNSSFPEFNGSVLATTEQRLVMLKLEGQRGASTTYRLRINADLRNSTNVGVGGIRTEGSGLETENAAGDLVGTWHRVVSSSVFNEFRAAFNVTRSDTSCNFARTNPPGTWFARAYPGAILGCPQGYGRVDVDELQLIENVTWTLGGHAFKAGVVASRFGGSGNYRSIRDGNYGFDVDRRFSLSDPASYPVRFNLFEGSTTWDYSRWSWGCFAQDSWRVTPDLTLHLGIRYDLDGSFTALNPWLRVDKGLNTISKDADNIAPRAGVVWTPFDNGRRTLVRAGAGAYYDENHSNVAGVMLLNSVLVDRSIRLVASDPGLNPFWPDTAHLRRFLAEALARNAMPDLSSLAGEIGSTPDFERDLQVPYTIQTSGGVSHQLTTAFNIAADVVFSRGLDQYIIRDVNIDRDAALHLGRIVRPNPNYGPINRYGNGGEFTYRGLLTQVEFMPKPGRFIRLSYTLARTESNTRTALDGTGRENSLSATNPFDYGEDFGPADNDVRHTLSSDWVMPLPYGFQFSGMLNARSAVPWSVATEQLDPDPFLDRPEPRNSRRGDPHFDLDLRLAKFFRFNSRQALAVFVESFNATNATNLAAYVARRTAAQFGRATAAKERRRIQIGFRVDF